MDRTGQSLGKQPTIDFAGQNSGQGNLDSMQNGEIVTNGTNYGVRKAEYDAQVVAPRAVTSAKAAINARFAEQKQAAPAVRMATSAREVVNAAASQTPRGPKSAANLHHGSIQKSLESTRTSASALLKRAEAERPIPTSVQTTSAADPLARSAAVPAPKRSVKTNPNEVPVVRTSLKLGAAARPKPAPVVLPPGARMAQVARPVNGASPSRSKGLAKLLQRAAPASLAPKAVSSTSKTLGAGNNNSVTVKVARPSGPVRDPQMRAAAKKLTTAGQITAAAQRTIRAQGTGAASMSLSAQKAQQKANLTMPKASRFRPKPKGYTAKPTASDNSYVMTEPPKLNLKRMAEQVERAEFGVVENYHAERVPEPIGDKAPIGSLKAKQVASGHGGAAKPNANIEADNSGNYSFLRKKEPKSDHHQPTASGESPFLKSVNVEKRPLSDSVMAVPSQPVSAKATKKSTRKNVYAKKNDIKRQELPPRPTVIVPSSRRSKAPLFFLIILTIILGAAVGAAAYLCFFQ